MELVGKEEHQVELIEFINPQGKHFKGQHVLIDVIKLNIFRKNSLGKQHQVA